MKITRMPESVYRSDLLNDILASRSALKQCSSRGTLLVCPATHSHTDMSSLSYGLLN